MNLELSISSTCFFSYPHLSTCVYLLMSCYRKFLVSCTLSCTFVHIKIFKEKEEEKRERKSTVLYHARPLSSKIISILTDTIC